MIRVIWRYARDLVGGPREPSPSLEEMSFLARRGFRDFATMSGAEPVFSVPGTDLRAEVLSMTRPGVDADKLPSHDLANYCHAFFADEAEALAALEGLRSDPSVEWAETQYPLSRPVWREPNRPNQPEFSSPVGRMRAAIDDFTARQEYLAPAPLGIDAHSAWSVPGGKGEGVLIFDLEVGWDLQHEDLRRKLVGLVHGSNRQDEDHGTAVLGILGADHNGTGVSGIAPDAACAVTGVDWDPAAGKWNPEDAILHVLRNARPGSILLLELQGAWPGRFDYVPVELWQSTLDVIKLATSSGFVVVQAAGNGGLDLDARPYGNYFDRTQDDSGAILVGSANPRDLSRREHSNFGTRLDLQAWGRDVVTTGGLREGDPRYSDLYRGASTSRCYTKSFAGTSSAAAIVAGAAACIQGALLAAGRSPLDSFAMRELLARTGTPQGDGVRPATEAIGPRPDLHEVFLELGLGPQN